MGHQCIAAIVGILAIAALFIVLEWMAVRRERAIAAAIEHQRVSVRAHVHAPQGYHPCGPYRMPPPPPPRNTREARQGRGRFKGVK